MRNFIIRALTGIVYVALLVGCTVWSPVTAFFFFALVAASCVGEFCMLVNRHAGASVVISLNVLAAFLLVASVWLYCIGSPTTGQSLALYVLLVIYLLVSELYRGSDNPLRNWALSLFSHVYAAVPFALLPMLSVRYDAAASSYAYTWQYPLALFV
ncbi:MAG: phosphatidate cytidylyltransferase, partial [Bacteroidaceae bacterium]|nr:phosphatidate cytidylyltransferase [Bacteroidaceae bacterium]